MSSTSERRSAQRFEYKQDATVVTNSGGKLKAHIHSISRSGIYLATYQEFELGTLMILGWKDEGRVIKGQFLIKVKQPSKDGQMWMYGVRFYKMDDASKANTKILLKRLSLPKTEDSQDLKIEFIQKTIAQGEEVFKLLHADQNINPLLRAKLKTIPELDLQAINNPLDDFEISLQQLYQLDLYAHLIFGYLHHEKNYVFEDLKNAVGLIENIFSDYIGVTAKDHPLPEMESLEDKGDREIEIIQAKHERRSLLQRSYNALSNQVYEACTNLARFFINEEWSAKFTSANDAQINTIKLGAHQLSETYKSKIQVTIDKVSDVDAILTRSYYEVENTSSDAPVVEQKPLNKEGSSHIKKMIVLAVLVIAFFVNAWLQLGTKNIKSQFEDQLKLPVKIQKIDREGMQLRIFITERNWNALDQATKEEVEKRVETFLESQTTFTGAIGYLVPGGIAFIKYKWG